MPMHKKTWAYLAEIIITSWIYQITTFISKGYSINISLKEETQINSTTPEIIQPNREMVTSLHEISLQ